MSTPTVLPASALAHYGPASTLPGGYARAALARGALYLLPVPLALAAREPLAAVPWPVPVTALAASWCALAVLSYLGDSAARHGARRGVRLVLAGFAGLAVLWSGCLGLVTVASPGGEWVRWLALSLPAFALAAAVTASQICRAEAMMLAWCLPALLVSLVTVAASHPSSAALAPHPDTVLLLLLAALALPTLRAIMLAWQRPRPRPGRGQGVAIAVASGRRLSGALTRLWLAASQAALVVLVWQASAGVAAGGLTPGLAPLLATVPATQLWSAWQLARHTEILATGDDREAARRSLRRLGWGTLGALLLPLPAAAALAATASRLPYGLDAHPTPPAVVLAFAAGALLGGMVALGQTLAVHGRPGQAALVTTCPLFVALLPAPPAPDSGWVAQALGVPAAAGGLLPEVAVGLAVAHAAGVVLAARVLLDPQRTAGLAVASFPAAPFPGSPFPGAPFPGAPFPGSPATGGAP